MATTDPTLGPALARALAHPAAAGDEAAIDDRILDAALELISAFGAGRTSIDDIAARAGVGRATVFRRFKTKDAVVERLLARETQRFLAQLRAAIAATSDPATSVVEAFFFVVRYFTTHPLLDRLARMESQALVDALRAGEPSAFEIGTDFVAQRLRSGQRRGKIPQSDADLLADALVRLTLSYLLIPSRRIDLRDDDEIRAFARTALAPLVTRRS
ncbi:TetR/AcrR family transcriptional regulator [Conexibacter woesei]|uniref:TetR/AcrR family transcriptional regulator n=1 Tax=Conexibacter woesei TaxID=191495 RepID=UPI0004189934|nr:TetR/AcrR family transcriptional regulator [Conexibacter woesei]